MPGDDRLIKTYNFWVRAGVLNIGEDGAPFPNKATIELQGDNTEEYFAFTPNIEAGNKNLVVTGTVNMYGQSRDMRTRLVKNAFAGQKDIYVDTNLDWAAGEKIVLAPTNMRTLDTDICEIESVVPAEGKVTCKEPLTGYHFGAETSTSGVYGVDMRGEVALLSRNI